MRRWLYTTRIVQGDPAQAEARLREDITELLADASAGRVSGRGVDGGQLLRLPGRVLGVDAEKTVRVRTGVAARRGERTVIPVSWEPVPGRAAFPSFEGTIEITPLDRAMAELTLVGSYRVPLGPLGAAVDATAMRSVAERTTEQLVDRVAEGLTARMREGDLEEAPMPRGSATRMLVADVMTADPVVLLDDLPVRTAALLLFHLGVSGAPVVSEDGSLVGVLSERDLLEKEALPPERLGRAGAEAARRRDALTVGDACTRPAITTVPEAPLRDAARLMVKRNVSRVVVVDGSRVAGILTRHDVLQALMRTDADLRTAAAEVLRAQGTPEVRATAVWGVVTVQGVVPRRSQVAEVLQALRDIDGVLEVEGDLTYEEDDVLPVMIGGPHL
jgi:CBS domain-containing protein